MVALTWFAETNVVVRAIPLKRTVEPETKLLPFTVSVKLPLPAVTEVGEMLVMEGTGLLLVPVTVNTAAVEVPPPGVGLVTVTLNVPEPVRSEAGITAVSWLAETYDVALALPLKLTTEPGMKLFPLMVSEMAELPAGIDAGEREVITGTTLPTVKVTAFEVPPPVVGLLTVMLKVPTEVRSDAGMNTFNWVGETYPVDRAKPLKYAVELGSKLVPLMVMVNAEPPTVPEAGEMLVMAGTAAMAAIGMIPSRATLVAATAAFEKMFLVFIFLLCILLYTSATFENPSKRVLPYATGKAAKSFCAGVI